jgi:tetratricopeptide (TPR) repeat protein
MATKESMVVAPLAVLLYDRVFEFTSMRDALRARGGFYAALAVTWVELGLLMWRWPRSTVGAAKVSPWTYLLNQAQMIVRYLWLSVWPHALVLDYGLPRSIGVGDVLPQALLLVAMLAGTIVALARWPSIGFLGTMFFLTLAPTSSLVPIASEVGAERRMYLPLAAVSVFAVTLGSLLLERLRARWPARSRALTATAAVASLAVVAALSVRTMARNREYAEPVSLWEGSVARWPNGRARFSLATEYISAGRHEEAVAQLREAVNDYPDARAGLGAELVMQGRPAEAIGVLNVFIDDKPSQPNRIPARLLLGQALLTQGQIEAAASQFKAILDLDPSSRSANQGMGIVARIQAARFLEQGKVAPAEVEAREALRRNPGDAEAHNILGAALASRGELAAAIQEFQEALRISPEHKSAGTNLARARAMSQPQRKP